MFYLFVICSVAQILFTLNLPDITLILSHCHHTCNSYYVKDVIYNF